MSNKLIFIQITPEQLNNIIETGLRKVLSEKENIEFEKQLFSINRTAKMFNIHASTLNKKIQAGFIETTPDGKHITGAQINKYLQNKNAVSDNKETA